MRDAERMAVHTQVAAFHGVTVEADYVRQRLGIIFDDAPDATTKVVLDAYFSWSDDAPCIWIGSLDWIAMRHARRVVERMVGNRLPGTTDAEALGIEANGQA